MGQKGEKVPGKCDSCERLQKQVYLLNEQRQIDSVEHRAINNKIILANTKLLDALEVSQCEVRSLMRERDGFLRREAMLEAELSVNRGRDSRHSTPPAYAKTQKGLRARPVENSPLRPEPQPRKISFNTPPPTVPSLRSPTRYNIPDSPPQTSNHDDDNGDNVDNDENASVVTRTPRVSFADGPDLVRSSTRYKAAQSCVSSLHSPSGHKKPNNPPLASNHCDGDDDVDVENDENVSVGTSRNSTPRKSFADGAQQVRWSTRRKASKNYKEPSLHMKIRKGDKLSFIIPDYVCPSPR